MSLEVLTKLSLNKGIQITVITFANVVAPYWFYFHYHPSLVAGDNIWKQLILCLSLGVPLTIVGFSCGVIERRNSRIVRKGKKETDNHLFQLITNGSIYLAIVLYIVVIVKFWVEFTSRYVAYLIIILYICRFIDSLLIARSEKKQLEKSDEMLKTDNQP